MTCPRTAKWFGYQPAPPGMKWVAGPPGVFGTRGLVLREDLLGYPPWVEDAPPPRNICTRCGKVVERTKEGK